MEYGYAKAKYIRVSPRKARLDADLIRGKSVQEAIIQLGETGRKGGRLLLKVLNSAVANAETQFDVRPESLRVTKVLVDEGPRLKRAKSSCRGSRKPIVKRTSHLTIVVGGS